VATTSKGAASILRLIEGILKVDKSTPLRGDMDSSDLKEVSALDRYLAAEDSRDLAESTNQQLAAVRPVLSLSLSFCFPRLCCILLIPSFLYGMVLLYRWRSMTPMTI
jgi:hypothetical protein